MAALRQHILLGTPLPESRFPILAGVLAAAQIPAA